MYKIEERVSQNQSLENKTYAFKAFMLYVFCV